MHLSMSIEILKSKGGSMDCLINFFLKDKTNNYKYICNVFKNNFSLICLQLIVFTVIGILTYYFLSLPRDDFRRAVCLGILWIFSLEQEGKITHLLVMPLPCITYIFFFYKAYKAKVSSRRLYLFLLLSGVIFYSLCYFLFYSIIIFLYDGQI